MHLVDNNLDITGVLHNWFPQHAKHVEEYVIWGEIHNDNRKRFKDGTRIHTSGVAKNVFPVEKLKEGDAIATRNSVYQLGIKYEPNTPKKEKPLHGGYPTQRSKNNVL